MWQRIGIRLAAICLSLVFIFVILPKIFGLLLPFLLAILFAVGDGQHLVAVHGLEGVLGSNGFGGNASQLGHIADEELFQYIKYLQKA